MITWLLGVFLVSHGLLHLAIWLPKRDEEEPAPLPFYPDHSALLTAVPARTTQRLAAGLATVVGMTYGLAGLAVVTSSALAPWVAGAAALLGLVLKVVFFHPWLSIGVAIDVVVLTAAVGEWPMGLA